MFGIIFHKISRHFRIPQAFLEFASLFYYCTLRVDAVDQIFKIEATCKIGIRINPVSPSTESSFLVFNKSRSWMLGRYGCCRGR